MHDSLAVAQETVNVGFINRRKPLPFSEMNFLIAKFATKFDFFALARTGTLAHIEQAFQASSPKTSMARPATAGPFSLCRPPSVYRLCDWRKALRFMLPAGGAGVSAQRFWTFLPFCRFEIEGRGA
ncbi:hypothetical protein GRI39_13085 [Altererythrobacter indicus]|uniref:Uncharacterized protein n=1 Tax=Altericroceibacterium indicum TaxID=374177 RepID=A0A845AEJ2_9SPHN|nr:hypothetical protein [Altericroceibacterium indicum]MXP26966.1 hypothetical protein [Altericroceibacterium indicum]